LIFRAELNGRARKDSEMGFAIGRGEVALLVRRTEEEGKIDFFGGSV